MKSFIRLAPRLPTQPRSCITELDFSLGSAKGEPYLCIQIMAQPKKKITQSAQLTIWTIGHSNRSFEDFLALLQANKIQALADVRRFPGSRRYPQFGQEQLSSSLTKSGIDYVHFPELGGRRASQPDSQNTAWRNAAFRGY